MGRRRAGAGTIAIAVLAAVVLLAAGYAIGRVDSSETSNSVASLVDSSNGSGATVATTPPGATVVTADADLVDEPAPNASDPDERTTAASATDPALGDSEVFVEVFDDDTGLERFRTGVFHRDADVHGLDVAQPGERTWTGDHDMDCGPPDTQRRLDKADREANLYTCKDHLMTSMGDVDHYSVVWFTPDQVFSDVRSISWDVNMTDLGKRQWWEVSIIPAGTPEVTAVDWIAGTANVASYDPASFVIGNGPFGSDIRVDSDETPNLTLDQSCGATGIDPEGCASKSIRRTWTATDNGDGTITIVVLDSSWTIDGSFPPGPAEVVFKDHNYAPDKDGPVVGHTWHWDDIVVET